MSLSAPKAPGAKPNVKISRPIHPIPKRTFAIGSDDSSGDGLLLADNAVDDKVEVVVVVTAAARTGSSLRIDNGLDANGWFSVAVDFDVVATCTTGGAKAPTCRDRVTTAAISNQTRFMVIIGIMAVVVVLGAMVADRVWDFFLARRRQRR